MNTQATTTQMSFLTIPEFKTKLGVDKVEIVKNPNTNKLFAAVGGKNFKVEQAIDWDLPLKFMFESDEKFFEGCIVNVVSENTIKTL